jgi:hypothetical protein
MPGSLECDGAQETTWDPSGRLRAAGGAHD